MGKEFSGPHRACPNVGAQKPKQCQHNPGSTTTDESVAKVFGILGATIIGRDDDRSTFFFRNSNPLLPKIATWREC